VIFQLVYTCALQADVSPAEVHEIAKSSRSRNMKLGLTGILLCKDGSVLQVLEGEKTVVTELYDRIEKDPRVKNSLVLIKRMTPTREFPNWSMGYRNADIDETSFHLTATTLSDAMPQDLSPELDTIGSIFARVNGLT